MIEHLVAVCPCIFANASESVPQLESAASSGGIIARIGNESPSSLCTFGVLLSFFVATLVVTFPLAISLTHGVPLWAATRSSLYGTDGGSAKAAADPKLSIWFTPYQYAPHGASLALHDLSPLNAYFQAWLMPFFGDFAAYNILIIAHYIPCAWGAYMLAWHLTGSRPGSVGLGIHLRVQHVSCDASFPAIDRFVGMAPARNVLSATECFADGGGRDGILLRSRLAVAALSSWYHLVFIGVAFGLMFIGQIGLKDSLGGAKRWKRAIIPWVIVVIILSPLLYAAVIEASKQNVDWRIGMGQRY